jgi:hypothetical protein
MTKNYFLFLAGAACIFLLTLSADGAGEMKAELECPPDVKLFDAYFARYGAPVKAITTDLRSVRVQLSSSFPKPEQLGLYSNFKVAGDFEISAKYEWTPVNVPKGGYGVSCGIKVETNDENKGVALARGNLPGKGSVYIVTEAQKESGEMKYTNKHFPTEAKKGRLVLLREKKEVVCLAGDGVGELQELCRLPFTEASLQRVLIVADPGAAPTDMDARISEFKIRAEEITHKIPKRDAPRGWGPWFAGGAFFGIAVGGYFAFRRYRYGQWGWSREDD